MSGRAVEGEGFGVAGVLRLAGGILRRHAPILVVLALTLGVAPTLLLHLFSGAVGRAMAPPVHTPEASLVAVLAYAAYMGGSALTHCRGFACDVAVVLVSLEEDRAPGRPAVQARGIVLRLVLVALATWIVGQLTFVWLPMSASLVVYAILNCWVVAVPVYAAEETPLRRLVGRTRAIFAKSGWMFVGLQAAYCAGEVGLNTIYIHLSSIAGRSEAADWAGRTVVLSAAALFGTAVAAAVVALYREMRRFERATPPPDVVEAFA